MCARHVVRAREISSGRGVNVPRRPLRYTRYVHRNVAKCQSGFHGRAHPSEHVNVVPGDHLAEKKKEIYIFFSRLRDTRFNSVFFLLFLTSHFKNRTLETIVVRNQICLKRAKNDVRRTSNYANSIGKCSMEEG